jgi:hypothetical protein
MRVGGYVVLTDPDFNGVYNRVLIPDVTATYCLRASCRASWLIASGARIRKSDIKQFRQACKEAGLTVAERYEASQALHADKESGESGQQDMSYGELLVWLREWKASWRPS